MNIDKHLKAEGLACISLTPEIKKHIREMQPGQVLEVFNNDPAAREGVPAWCRLTGNALLQTKEINPTDTIFLIQKKNS